MSAKHTGSSKHPLLGSHHRLFCPLSGSRPGTGYRSSRTLRFSFISTGIHRLHNLTPSRFQHSRTKAAPAGTAGSAGRRETGKIFDNVEASSTASEPDSAAFDGFSDWSQRSTVPDKQDRRAASPSRSKHPVGSGQSASVSQGASGTTQSSQGSQVSTEQGTGRSEEAEQSQPYVDDWGEWGWPASPAVASSASSPLTDTSSAAGAQTAHEAAPPPVMEASEVESALELPDLTELTMEEVERVLPITPSPEQIKRASGSPYDLYSRLGTAAFVSLLTIKVVLVATLAVLYPLLGPLLQALNRNRELRSKGRHVALWRASVVECAVEVDPAWAGRLRPPTAWGQPEVLRLLIGDRSGAHSQLSVPYEPQHKNIQVGDAAELLVLAPQRTFKRFQALREIYIPQAGIWVADYPHISRDRFLDLSLTIEQERQSQQRPFEYSVS